VTKLTECTVHVTIRLAVCQSRSFLKRVTPYVQFADKNIEIYLKIS